MMQKDKISVVVPTYNREKLIKKTVQSLLKQTYDNLEIIIIDDGSTDNTEEVINEFADKRIKYIKLKKNKGACHARNVGIKKSKGKYITFLDSDDVYYKDKVKMQYENLISNNSDIDICKIKVTCGNNHNVIPNDEAEKNILNKDLFNQLCSGNFISTPTIFGKKDIFKKSPFDETLPRMQDYDLALRITKNYSLSYTNKILVHSYIQPDSISSSDEKLIKAIDIMLDKDYSFNEKQRNNFKHYLLDIYKSSRDQKYLTLNHEYNLLNVKYSDLIKEYSHLKNKYDNVNNSYKTIINSKKFKLLNKISTIFKKK